MGDQINNYIENSFNLHQAYSYILLLQVEASSFNYAVISNNRLLASEQNCDLQELFHPEKFGDLLTAKYKKVIVGLPGNALTLVPKSLFKEDHVAGIARLLDVKETEKVLAQTLDDQNIIIYKTNSELVSAVEKFDLKNTVYTASGWITAIAESYPSDSNLYLEIGKDTVQLLYFSSNKLRFYNTFEFKSADDLVYFTALVADELQLIPEQTTLILSGDVNLDDSYIKKLADFYPNIEINSISVLELPAQIDAHKLLALASLSLCESSVVL
ncbi:MAG: hypothetical protein JWP44_1433 [Mucilaginibacter sp.]|nr:hypothetical protein [Mucilaginibacter sp.]